MIAKYIYLSVRVYSLDQYRKALVELLVSEAENRLIKNPCRADTEKKKKKDVISMKVTGIRKKNWTS